MKRILFFVHYNKYNGLSDYVVYLLEHIKHIYSRVVFISNSPLSAKQQEKIAPLCGDIILRENKGFDFGAWKDALFREGWDALAQYDSVTLMNDTCFGPLFDMEDVYEDMEKRDVDFWGITICEASKTGMPITGGPIPEHIQSYFLCFSKTTMSSEVFWNFWENVRYQENVNTVIELYETQLTRTLSMGGLTYRVLIPPPLVYSDSKDSGCHRNIMIEYFDFAIKNKSPFVKIKTFVCFQHPKFIIDLIQEKTNYPINLIYDYVTEMLEPNVSIRICNKLIPAINKVENNITAKVAIHLHVFYIDVFEEYIRRFNNIGFNFDLFITTDTDDKEKQIKSFIKNTFIENKLKQIIITENRGRDILPWLCLADTLNKYDVVGHFHTKKTPTSKFSFLGESWQRELFELLLNPVYAIITEFQNNKKIGIIIPDIPFFYQIIEHSIYGEYGALLQPLWEKMNCTRFIDFEKINMAIMPYGTMFWYRPAALRPLFDLCLCANDFQPEPLPVDGTIAHCIERLLVYIAWSNGFDYRIMTFYPPKVNAFMANSVLADVHSDYLVKIKNIENSKSYLLGKLILLLPRYIKKVFKT
jgi:rhamnosyltransferase